MLGRLPPEILQFFSNPGGHSLLIKGQAGTGKTTFALQLLESLFGFERNFYLSSRVSDRTLFNQFPWLVERERTERLLSASRQFLSAIHGPEGAQHEVEVDKNDLRHAKVSKNDEARGLPQFQLRAVGGRNSPADRVNRHKPRAAVPHRRGGKRDHASGS